MSHRKMSIRKDNNGRHRDPIIGMACWAYWDHLEADREHGRCQFESCECPCHTRPVERLPSVIAQHSTEDLLAAMDRAFSRETK